MDAELSWTMTTIRPPTRPTRGSRCVEMDLAQVASPLEPLIVSRLHDALHTRYFALSGLVVILWEHLATLDQEVEIIWKASRFTLSRIIFCLGRYGLICSLMYTNTVLIFLPPSRMSAQASLTCQTFASILVFCIVLSAIGTNTYLTLRHLQAWDGRRGVFYVVLTSLILTHVTALVLGAFGMKDVPRNTTYIPFLDTCAVFAKAPTLAPAWACIITFDSIVILLSFLNILDRPRRSNASILLFLRKDGAPFFLTVFALRYTGLILFIKLPATQYYLASFLAWPLASITLSRFILCSEKMLMSSDDGAERSIHELSDWP
ncbi:hypothetical protein BC835DRAFT_1377849 [Cytidiella melzeri]|nr:hypothetical protein BC835DRAFT_1377849 [Cytidiella melzeri]